MFPRLHYNSLFRTGVTSALQRSIYNEPPSQLYEGRETLQKMYGGYIAVYQGCASYDTSRENNKFRKNSKLQILDISQYIGQQLGTNVKRNRTPLL